MAEHPENNWEQLKSELNVRFAELNDPSCFYSVNWQCKSNVCLYRFTQRGCMFLANDVFTKVDKTFVESQLLEFSLMGWTMISYT